MRTWYRSIGLAVLGLGLLAGCDGGPGALAPYEGERPLTLLRVTQSFTPDIQWVGGRVAAVGVNRGSRAALDSTLVWLQAADDNTISSHVTVGQNANEALVRQFGGTPLDSLSDEQEYTFWLAEKSVFDSGLNTATTGAFADTTVTMGLLLKGTTRGGTQLTFRIVKEERLLGTRYVLDWTPRTKAFRQIAIRKGAGSPAFTDLVWHVAQEPGTPDAILPPVVIGEAPGAAGTAIPWPETGFEPDTYTLWMTDNTWDSGFLPRSSGLAYFVIFETNFPDDPPTDE